MNWSAENIWWLFLIVGCASIIGYWYGFVFGLKKGAENEKLDRSSYVFVVCVITDRDVFPVRLFDNWNDAHIFAFEFDWKLPDDHTLISEYEVSKLSTVIIEEFVLGEHSRRTYIKCIKDDEREYE